MKMLNIKINGKDYQAPEGSTILEACRLAGIEIPTLCYLKDINEIGACRMCVVEVKGARTLVAACVYPINEGIEIVTNSRRVLESRRNTVRLILSNHKRDCLSCVRGGNCELLHLAAEFGIDDAAFFKGEMTQTEIDESAPHLIRDNSKCILCRRCVAVCEKNQAVGVIGPNNRGFNTIIGSQYDLPLNDTSCINCGQCINVCPTGALQEKSDIEKIIDALQDPTKHVIVQTAPAVRAAIAEEFGCPVGTNGQGKMVAALKALGFEKVFDTNFAADLTIMEEGTELLDRINNGGVLPMITSCSPGWIRYIENYFPDLLPHLSTCKSPQQMFGAVLKTYYAEKNNINPKDIVSISVMPCVAKKYEIHRDDQCGAGKGIPDLDYTMTTRELARMIKMFNISWDYLDENAKFDDPLGEGSGAAVIFGATGGVMEAALRTVRDILTNGDAKDVDFKEVRGMNGVKEASYAIKDGLTVKVAIVSGTANAKVLLEKIRKGEADYQFIEVMCCPGGCINGGGQPRVSGKVRNTTDYRSKRAEVLYKLDEGNENRKSHKNKAVDVLYKEYFEKPGSHKAHEALHTSYQKRDWT